MGSPIDEVFGKTLELLNLEIELGEGMIEERDGRNEMLKMKSEYFQGSAIPVIRINDYVPRLSDLTYFNISYNKKIPQIELVLNVNISSYTSFNDGDIVSVMIKDQNPDTAQIRNDFTLDDIDENTTRGKTTFSITGELNIPKLHSSINKAYTGTSFEVLQEVANELGIGFASNFDGTDDSMTWIASNETYYEFINKVAKHSWVDDGHYTDWYINQHYHLVFYENNDTLIPNLIDDIKLFIDGTNSVNDELVREEMYTWSNTFTNVGNMRNTNFFIENLKIKNKSKKISKKKGYVNKFYFLDYSDLEEVEFETETISNSDNGNPLKGLPDDTNYVNEVKVNSLGMQNPNMHPQYYYAFYHNTLNNKELDKINIEIKVKAYNLYFAQGDNVKVVVVDDKLVNDLPEISQDQILGKFEGKDTKKSNDYKIQGVSFDYKKGKTNTYYILTRREFPSDNE